MERAQRLYIWQLAKDGQNVCIFYWTVELLFVLQPVDMGIDLSKFSGDWLQSEVFFFFFSVLWINQLLFAGVLGALPFI